MAKKKTKKAARKTTPRVVRKKTTSQTAKPKTRAKKSSSPRRSATDMMADVQNLMQMMVSNDVTEIKLEDGSRKIALKRGAFLAPTATPAAVVPVSALPPTVAEPAEDLIEITSPMVGTFYTAASPDSDPYVNVGTKVNGNAVVCIIEAMKVMNEIKAECSGTIAEICVKNGEPVEFGQVLFRVESA